MIYVDPDPRVFSFDLPLLGRPLLWYGVLFALGFFLSYLVFIRLLKNSSDKRLSSHSQLIGERLSLYLLIGVIVGARLFDVLFYQDVAYIKADPFSVLRVWEGGLASHGGAIGAVVSAFIFFKRYQKKFPSLNWRRLLDFISISSPIAAFFIRIGNFMNQEVLGTATNLAWGCVFLHPLDKSPVIPRHPVQIYEAVYYLFLFFIFYGYLYKKKWQEGKLTGVFLICLFSFRFFIEFFKERQSQIELNFLEMGQLLSLPLIFFGIYLIFIPRSKKF